MICALCASRVSYGWQAAAGRFVSAAPTVMPKRGLLLLLRGAARSWPGLGGGHGVAVVHPVPDGFEDQADCQDG